MPLSLQLLTMDQIGMWGETCLSFFNEACKIRVHGDCDQSDKGHIWNIQTDKTKFVQANKEADEKKLFWPLLASASPVALQLTSLAHGCGRLMGLFGGQGISSWSNWSRRLQKKCWSGKSMYLRGPETKQPKWIISSITERSQSLSQEKTEKGRQRWERGHRQEVE